MPTAHPDHDAEQRYLDHAHAHLDAMRQRTTQLASLQESAAQRYESELASGMLRRRLATMAESSAPLCFGRLDHDTGERWYVGRRHIEDDGGEPVVVDWRAEVSIPFYRATVQDRLGLDRRRRFTVDGRRLIDILEEDFTDPDAAVVAGGIPDPLLSELGRARTGEMRDIVATIQAEQDVVIRAPMDRLVVVQGGPGTGKTAVGLHRAAFLLYEHRGTLEDERVLVIGPNPVFLRYISAVLPSLGETAVVQTTIESLLGARYPVRAADGDGAAVVKGDARMAAVLGRARDQLRRRADADLELRLAWGVVRISAADLNAVLDDTAGRKTAFAVGRDVLRRRLEDLVLSHLHPNVRDDTAVRADLRANREWQALVGRMWPAASAAGLVRRVIGNRRALARAADGVLDSAEQQAIRRRAASRVTSEPWTAADVPLLDEAEALLSGPPPAYGHVVVDEAQDLSAMALRMAARRAPHGSLTVLGDLAQATAAAAQRSWAEAVAHLGGPPGATIDELTIGYRVPAPILDLANRLLPIAAPHVRPAIAARTDGEAPSLLRAAPGDLVEATATEAARQAQRWTSVGVVVPPDLVAAVDAALAARGIEHGRGQGLGRGEQLSILPPEQVKGLEFDAVVVAEPAAIAKGAAGGMRSLYVAMTRAVQHLSLVHERDLPAPLRGAR